jgi:hypothetical protein
LFRVELSFFECVDRGARVTRVTMTTARYLATRKILRKILRIESHHHYNGNVSDRTSMDIDLINTYLLDEIYISVLLIGTKSFGVFWSFGENSMTIYRDGRQISNRQEEVHKRERLKIK